MRLGLVRFSKAGKGGRTFPRYDPLLMQWRSPSGFCAIIVLLGKLRNRVLIILSRQPRTFHHFRSSAFEFACLNPISIGI